MSNYKDELYPIKLSGNQIEALTALTQPFMDRAKMIERQRIIFIIEQAQAEAMTGNGGYSREVAEAFGQSWPLKTGWKKKLINRINEIKEEGQQ